MRRRGVWMGVCLLAFSTAAWGDAGFTFVGNNVGAPTMTVPNSLVSLSGRTGRYSVQPFFPGPENVLVSCDIFGVQDGPDADSVLLVYEGSFEPTLPLQNLIAYNDDAGDVGVSRIEDLELSFSSDYYLVTVSYNVPSASTFSNHIQCLDDAERILAGDGSLRFGNTDITAYDGRVTEVGGGRFQISVIWTNFADVDGFGYAVPIGSNDSAIFYFFEPQNWELLIKVIDGCGLNGRYWVYMAATTNVEFHLAIRDTRNTGQPEDDVFYFVHNALGSFANSLRQDINAFNTCEP